MLLAANKRFAYKNKLLTVGETFEVPNKLHARAFMLNNLASPAPEPTVPFEDERAIRIKRKYKRRDMQAIDE